MVVLIRQAEPALVGLQHARVYAPLRRERVHHHGQQTLALLVTGSKIAHKGVKILRHHVQHRRVIAPHVHAHERLGVERDALALTGRIADRAVGAQLNLVRLVHLAQQAVFGRAHAARDRAEGAHGVFQPVADHGGVLRAVQLRQRGGNGVDRAAAVKIIGVDDGERRFDHIACAQHGVHRAERLFALRQLRPRRGEALRRLKRIVDPDAGALLDAVAEEGAHILQHLRLDDEHDAVKPGAQRVVDRVFHEDLAVGAETLDLLDAAIARARARPPSLPESYPCMQPHFVIEYYTA